VQGYVGRATLPYGRQVISVALNSAASTLLTRLLELQARAKAREPLKAKSRLRCVFGLREAAKSLRARKCKALLVAPNVEASSAPGSLDEQLGALLAAAEEAEVPIVLALTRARLGALTGRPRSRSSCAALLDCSGCEEGLRELLALAAAGRREWKKEHPEGVGEMGPGGGSGAASGLIRFDRYGREARLRKADE